MKHLKELVKNVVADREASGFEYVDGFEDAKDRVIEIINAEELSKGHKRIGFVDEEMAAALSEGSNSSSGHTEKRIYGEETKRRTYTVTDKVRAELQRLGKGNASAGIREAVRIAQSQ